MKSTNTVAEVKSKFNQKIFELKDNLDKNLENSKNAIITQFENNEEKIKTLIESLLKDMSSLKKIKSEDKISSLSKNNKKALELWKDSLLGILARKDNITSGLLPQPEFRGNDDVFDTTMEFTDQASEKKYKYHMKLTITRE